MRGYGDQRMGSMDVSVCVCECVCVINSWMDGGRGEIGREEDERGWCRGELGREDVRMMRGGGGGVK